MTAKRWVGWAAGVLVVGSMWNAFADPLHLSYNEYVTLEGAVYAPDKMSPPDDQYYNHLTNVCESTYGILGSFTLPLKPILPWAYLFANAHLMLGREYDNIDMAGLNWEYGGGIKIVESFGFRITHGAYEDLQGPAPDGLIWAGVSARYQTVKPVDLGPVNLRGYAEFFFFPPHNEYDPNPAQKLADRTTARYAADLRIEARPSNFLTNAFVFGRGFMPMGESRPQTDYNYRADPICLSWQAGAGYVLTPWAAVKFTVADMEGFNRFHRPGTLRWTSISVELKF